MDLSFEYDGEGEGERKSAKLIDKRKKKRLPKYGCWGSYKNGRAVSVQRAPTKNGHGSPSHHPTPNGLLVLGYFNTS